MCARIYVTGYGIVSAAGIGARQTLETLRAGRSGIAPVAYLDTAHSGLPAGEVALSNQQMAGRLGLNGPVAELRTAMLGMMASREAVRSAGLSPDILSATAFVNGTTVGGMDMTERYFGEVREADGDTDKARMLAYNDCGRTTDIIADSLGDVRMATTVSTACSSAANAIAFGAALIQAGVVDVAIAGGCEALTRFHLNGFNSLMILDSERCRPFDAGRAGINLGEGAAYLVLESGASAAARGMRPRFVLSGYANACDAYHQTASSDNGEGAYRAMAGALAMAGLTPADISYINAHGTGTNNNDASELAAMTRLWGDRLPPFSSTKSCTGHTTSASGAIESVICLLAMEHGLLPANLGFTTPIRPGAEPVGTVAEGVSLRHVVNNSFGFGGNDTSLVFSTNNCDNGA